MKTNINTLGGGLILAVALTMAQAASAFYDANLGRWINRDPIGEPGFEKVARDLTGGRSDSLNLYAFVSNDPIDNVDPLGLLKFEGCSDDQKKQIEQQFKDYAKKLDDQAFKDCMCNNAGIPGKLKSLSNDPGLTVKCEAKNTGNCKDACAWSLPGGKTIHLCPPPTDPNKTCAPIGCKLLHEMTHQIGHPFEKWPDQVEKCLGCP